MALKKLPNSIQSLFCASTQMNSYKKAIEELFYNAIDANALSIAIRVNIEENTIQVIDNGYGVAKSDLSLLGQRYTTSKCVDMNVLKSAPDKYGFRGQFLASIIEVSQCVKITSRCENSDETWIKVFHKGKEKELSETAPRPSKGTTVQIKGFLYNLNIQKRVINSLNELNDIKSFLEQLSLVHNNISLSLRDEAKDEIVFKLHKNRDIYQTLSSLFGVGKKDFQELKVEKNQYKVTGYIGKNNDANQQHWVYLNGKLVQNSKLHKVVHDNLTKAFGLRCNQTKRNAKSKNACNEEENVSYNKKIPFYFIFINCPYYDYDISDVPNKSIVEFKNWEQINKLLDKLVKFYVGDIKLKEIAKPMNKVLCTEKEEKTREQVKKIMEKILRSNPKKLAVSQMQNGIRGKLIKRKAKKKTLKLTLTKVLPLKDKERTKTDNIKIFENDEISNHEDFSITSQQNGPHLNCKGTGTKLQTEIMDKKTETMMRKKQEKTEKVSNYKLNNEKKKIYQRKCDKIKSKVNSYKMPIKNNHNEGYVISKNSVQPKRAIKNVKHKISKTISTKRPQKSKEVKSNSTKKNIQNDPLISHFEKATNSVKQRCNILATKVNDLMTYKKPKRQVFINETVHYSSVIKNNKNVAIRKKVGEIIIHDYVPLPPKANPCSFDNRVWDGPKKKTYVSTYDLVQTILKSQQTDYENAAKIQIPDEIPYQPVEEINFEPILTEPCSTNVALFPRQTYESHNYYHDVRNRSQENHEFYSHTKKQRNMQFITKQSRDNFITAKERETYQNKMKTGFKRLYFLNKKSCDKRPTLLSMFNLVDKETEHHTSYSIEFSKSNDKELNADTVITNGLVLFQKQYKDGTYTIERGDDLAQLHPSKICSTYTIITSSNPSKRMECDFNKQIHADVRKNTDSSYQSINVHEPCHSIFFSQRYEENTHTMRYDTQENEQTNNYVNVESEHDNIEVPNNIDIEPLNVCETILPSQNDERHQLNNQFHSWNSSLINNLFEDSLSNDGNEINSLLCDRNVYSNVYKESCQIMEADIEKQPYDLLERNNKTNVEQYPNHNLNCEEINNDNVIKVTRQTQNINLLTDIGCMYGNGTKILNKKMNNFSMKNRHRFVPKGLSPIFENCQSKNMCDYNLDKDYFEKTLYSNFATDVQINSEIFEPRAQNVNELATRDIEKVNIRLNKDHASLIFNGESLKHANVLSQVDEKFISAKIKGKSHQSNEMSEYLVLFDQHAVHERIRLENNLKDYIKDDKWNSITLDDIPLKLSKNEIIYLHNYKEKFTQFGLQWTVLNNCEVLIHAIPEAVLGKNPRQVDVVIKAVRNLISEEINTIKSQKGCVRLYPKSIMDLVFSEACRYAIKFGDRLSKHACMELLGSLSECKNPFQCAHGRPVMAVVMEVKSERRKYELTLPKVNQFVRRSKRIK